MSIYILKFDQNQLKATANWHVVTLTFSHTDFVEAFNICIPVTKINFQLWVKMWDSVYKSTPFMFVPIYHYPSRTS